MSCIISAPSTDAGKTTLSLLISCWAYTKGLKLQTFKVGPDYLDQEQLSSIGHPMCRNLDIFLSGEDWVKNSFYEHSNKFDLALIEFLTPIHLIYSLHLLIIYFLHLLSWYLKSQLISPQP